MRESERTRPEPRAQVAITEFGGHPSVRCNNWLNGFLQMMEVLRGACRPRASPAVVAAPTAAPAAPAGRPLRRRPRGRRHVAAVARLPARLVVRLECLAHRPLGRLRAVRATLGPPPTNLFFSHVSLRAPLFSLGGLYAIL